MKLKRSLLVLFTGLLVTSTAPSQAATFISETTWGGPGSESVGGTAIASDGSTYLAGTTRSFDEFSQAQIFLVKIAPDDSVTWQRTWDGPGNFTNHEASDVAVATDGSVYVTGSTSGVAGDVVLLKYSPDGSLLWQQRWDSNGGTEGGEALAVGSDGSVYVVGGTSAGGGNILVLKFLPDGSVVWQKTYGPAGGFMGIAVEPDGNVYVAGSAAAGDGSFGSDLVLFKINPLGELIWQRSYSAVETDDSRGGIAVAPDGSVYVAGAIQDSSRKLIVDALLVKFTPDGTLVWDRSWGGRSGDVSGAVGVKSDGTVLWAGETNGIGAGSDDAFLVQMSPAGRSIDSSTWGGTGIEHGEGVEVASDGTVALGATAENPPYTFQDAPMKTSRLRGAVATPTFAFQDVAGATAEAGGTTADPGNHSPGEGGFEAALVRIGP
jgi:uncharacterized delta-60 repeat protein